MAQIQSLRQRIRFCSRERQRIFLALLLGSLFGAAAVMLQPKAISSELFGAARRVSLPIVWFRASFFSTVIYAVSFSRRRALIRLLFFLKGSAISYTLCSYACSGAELFLDLLPTFFLETLLPLPLLILCGSLWADQAEDGYPKLWLLLPLLALIFFAVFLETLFF